MSNGSPVQGHSLGVERFIDKPSNGKCINHFISVVRVINQAALLHLKEVRL